VNKKQLRILVAPLDWGLGHVTRCVPIMKHLLHLGHQVIFAGNASQEQYIKSIFPKIETLFLEGYNVRYAKKKIGLVPRLIAQIPRLKKRIKKEHLWLQEAIKTHKLDCVLSDNRYGLYSNHIPCIIITHQLQILSGYSNYIDKFLLKIHYKFIERFNQCWVVDIANDNGLSGNLAHPPVMPKIKTEYIGLLSQCANQPIKKGGKTEAIILILLSGAEPQRSILSDSLWKKAVKSDKHIIFVEGNENAVTPTTIPNHISYHKRLSANNLITAINESSIVICRSGYSSLMDLVAMNKKAILIPTPGQTEQEYLAKLMHQKKFFMAAQQHKFDIQTSLLNAAIFGFTKMPFENAFDLHKQCINQWLNEIKGKP
jgi:uncharacterized protein (TIGR00661 family)